MRERDLTADLVQENRRLRAALAELLDQIEADSSNGVDTSAPRNRLGNGADNEIQPPWERDGFDSKQAWLDDKRGR